MQPRIETLVPKKLIGQKIKMSFANYRIAELWQSFGPKQKHISNKTSSDRISLVLYPPNHFVNFNPVNEFERWEAVEVTSFENIPGEMETFELIGGLYAVFDFKGLNTDNSIFQYILGTWIPNSNYEMDERPHFEILGDKYKNNDPESEEEIWIPVKKKMKD